VLVAETADYAFGSNPPYALGFGVDDKAVIARSEATKQSGATELVGPDCFALLTKTILMGGNTR
jgi:hypothetical protein